MGATVPGVSTAVSPTTAAPAGPGARGFGAIFGPATTYFSLVALALSFVLPAKGIGVTLCFFKNATHLPCPGCGLTRSITCISHLALSEAVHDHPFGPAFYAIGLASIAGKLAGARRRERLAAWFDRNARPAQAVYWTFIGAFVAYGLVRLGLSAHDPSLFSHV